MQISTCARLPSSNPFARLSLRRKVMGRAWNSSIIPQKLGLGTTRDPAQSTPALNQRILKCKAATEDDIIDVEGKEIDNRIPVTVSSWFNASVDLILPLNLHLFLPTLARSPTQYIYILSFSPYLLQVITGFLGSGKTTLLNRILNTDHGHRIAVIENEVCLSF